MKRFLLFEITTYYPSGGWNDFVGAFDNLSAAAEAAKVIDNKGSGYTYSQIIDTETMSEVDYDGTLPEQKV